MKGRGVSKKPESLHELFIILHREGFEIESADAFIGDLTKKPNVALKEARAQQEIEPVKKAKMVS